MMSRDQTWAPTAAATLLERRGRQVMWMRTPTFRDQLATYAKSNGLGDVIDPAPFAEAFTRQWTDGERLVTSFPTAAALVSAAGTLEHEVIPRTYPEDLPCPEGVALLPRTLYATSPTGQRVGVTAISWGPCMTGPGTPGVLMATWTAVEAISGSRASMRAKADEALEGTQYMRRALGNDTDTPPDEKKILEELINRRARDAKKAQARAERAPHPGEFALLDVQPLPFGHRMQLAVTATEDDRTERTVSLDDTSTDSATLVTRLPYALWSLITSGHLTTAPVELTPRIRRKHSKKPMPYEVTAVDVHDTRHDLDQLTVIKERPVGTVDSFYWTVQPPHQTPETKAG